MKKALASLLAAGMAASLLAGCGGSSSTAASTADTSTAASTEASSTTESDAPLEGEIDLLAFLHAGCPHGGRPEGRR